MHPVVLRRVLLPALVGAGLLAAWWLAWAVSPVGTVPSPPQVVDGFGQEIASGRLATDLVASLYRVSFGFVLAAVLAIPLGVAVGRSLATRLALLPWVNFFRSISPIAWIPFAILWFGIGDPPAIFIIFMATFFQLVLATAAAAAGVPRVYYRVAEDLKMSRADVLVRVTIPAIMPQLSTALRVAIGVAWMVIVAAEMMGLQSGIGFLIIDARSALRMDLVVVGMITVGVIGIAIDWLFSRIARIPSVRWGFER
jgi:NitT/TauT family transport system permease protein